MTADTHHGLADTVRRLAGRHAHDRGPLLPVLHDLQHELGYVPPEALPLVARELNRSRAEVYGVMTDHPGGPVSDPAAPVTVYVPGDTSARSAGADDVAAQLREHLGDRVRVVRNGSRGLLWLEPLVEVATPRGRAGWGPVTPASVR